MSVPGAVESPLRRASRRGDGPSSVRRAAPTKSTLTTASAHLGLGHVVSDLGREVRPGEHAGPR
jgi:hypothetical protein